VLATLSTIGHSTRSLGEFFELLRENDVQILVDVRTWPHSERYPYFNRDSLEESLRLRGVRYEWLGKELGGFRKKGLGDQSPNNAWKSQSFRNYADHTMTEEFREGIAKLLELAGEGKTAFMCAERYYRKCHRQIISDYLSAKGNEVIHIVDKGKIEKHNFTRFARVAEGELRYPNSPATTCSCTDSVGRQLLKSPKL
jgi:uncharacterized protein (DUF488 family)